MLELLISLLISVFPACPTEDSTSCVWDAGAQGNGVGTSFVSDQDGNAVFTW